MEIKLFVILGVIFMKIEKIKSAVQSAAEKFPIKSVILFGSQANGTATENSDVDLIIEFTKPVTLITLAELRDFLETVLNKNVDIVHGPIRNTDLLEIDRKVEIYAA